MTVKVSIATVSILREGLTQGRGVKYKRLAEALEKSIGEGLIEPGSKLPPHRLLADSLGVTVGTISRAYGELERVGLVVARVGDGTYVRQRGMERSRDSGFRNVSDEPQALFDMSRNQPIPGQEAAFLAAGLQTWRVIRTPCNRSAATRRMPVWPAIGRRVRNGCDIKRLCRTPSRSFVSTVANTVCCVC